MPAWLKATACRRVLLRGMTGWLWDRARAQAMRPQTTTSRTSAPTSRRRVVPAGGRRSKLDDLDVVAVRVDQRPKQAVRPRFDLDQPRHTEFGQPGGGGQRVIHVEIDITRLGPGLARPTSERPSVSILIPPKSKNPSSSYSRANVAIYHSRSRSGSALPRRILPSLACAMIPSGNWRCHFLRHR